MKRKRPTQPGDVTRYLAELAVRAAQGTKKYRKDRQRLERRLELMLDEHNIAGTNNERFWYLKGAVVLLGKETVLLRHPENKVK